MSIMDPHQSHNFFKTSPARDALSELLEMPVTNEDSVSNDIMSGDANSLIVDLNDLLKRDPTLSSLSDDPIIGVSGGSESNFDFMTGMQIPKVGNTIQVPNNSPATWTSTTVPPPNARVIKQDPTGVLGSQVNFPFQPTLAQLNTDGIKMETNDYDYDEIQPFFVKNNSPNVTLGIGPPPSIVAAAAAVASTSMPASQPTKFQWATEDSTGFTGTSNPWSTTGNTLSGGTASSVQAVPMVNTNQATVASYNISPLSDILSDLSSPNSGSTPNQSLSPNLPTGSPSQAGPTRSSTLHKLLMRKDQARQVTGRPSPVRSPDGTTLVRPNKTLEIMRHSLSSSSTLLSQQQMSTSAPVNHSYMSEAAAAASGSGHPRIWARREPRPHISSVCSVGESSTLADEVNEVLGRIDPNDLQDIVSDDEDDQDDNLGQGGQYEDSDDESDLEGTSPSTSKLNTSGSGSKKERHFWQYNVQAKGPKGQKINFETKIEDPHKLNDIVDPVFSGDVKMQGIKHSGKARRGDGNDLTANPKKLAAIGKELDQLSKIINDLTPVSEQPFGARCKSRKEKNKLASRACRLKKKAQHEANKLKCEGLNTEHNELIAAIKQVKALLMEKADPSISRSQHEITNELDHLVAKALVTKVAGQTSEYVNSMIEAHSPNV